VGEVIEGELAQAVVTEPVDDRRLVVEHLLDEALVALVHSDTLLPPEPVPLSAVSKLALVLPPGAHENPLRIELARRRRRARSRPRGGDRGRRIRLIADMVAAGELRVDSPRDGAARDLGDLALSRSRRCLRGRLAIVNARDVQLSLADRAVREPSPHRRRPRGCAQPETEGGTARGNGAKTRTRNATSR